MTAFLLYQFRRERTFEYCRAMIRFHGADQKVVVNSINQWHSNFSGNPPYLGQYGAEGRDAIAYVGWG